MLITDKFVFFWGGIYSQWYKSNFVINGWTYVSAEQYMMWSKAMLFNDEKIATAIRKTNNPSTQKSLGRKVKGFDKSLWDKYCRIFVYQANYAKFSQNTELLMELLSTGDKEIVEASPEDTIWGIGMYETDPDILDKSKWRGTNWLGIEIMNVREALKNISNQNKSIPQE